MSKPVNLCQFCGKKNGYCCGVHVAKDVQRDSWFFVVLAVMNCSECNSDWFEVVHEAFHSTEGGERQ